MNERVLMGIRATTVGGDFSGDLIDIKDCFLKIGDRPPFHFHTLPDLSESKAANYQDEVIIGRASPIKTYSDSANRTISAMFTLIVRKKADIKANLQFIRAVQSAVYPRQGDGSVPYRPPVVCQFQCGALFQDPIANPTLTNLAAINSYVCCVIKDYSLKYPTDVPWDEETMLPYRVELSCNLDVVYKSENLPGQERIISLSDNIS